VEKRARKKRPPFRFSAPHFLDLSIFLSTTDRVVARAAVREHSNSIFTEGAM